MNSKEMKMISLEELKIKLEDLLDEQANLNIQRGTHQLVNPGRVRLVRKEIARVKTILREYELGISKPKEQIN